MGKLTLREVKKFDQGHTVGKAVEPGLELRFLCLQSSCSEAQSTITGFRMSRGTPATSEKLQETQC